MALLQYNNTVKLARDQGIREAQEFYTDTERTDLARMRFTSEKVSIKKKESWGLTARDYDDVVADLCSTYNVSDFNRRELERARTYELDVVQITEIFEEVTNGKYVFGIFATRHRSDGRNDIAYAIYRNDVTFHVVGSGPWSANVLKKYFKMQAKASFLGISN